MATPEKTDAGDGIERPSSIVGADGPDKTVEAFSDPVHLDRNRFSVLGAVGIHWSSTASPLAICSTLQLVIGVGGSPFYFWAFIVAACFQFMVALSLAELASVYPHTSGMSPFTRRNLYMC